MIRIERNDFRFDGWKPSNWSSFRMISSKTIQSYVFINTLQLHRNRRRLLGKLVGVVKVSNTVVMNYFWTYSNTLICWWVHRDKFYQLMLLEESLWSHIYQVRVHSKMPSSTTHRTHIRKNHLSVCLTTDCCKLHFTCHTEDEEKEW